MTGFFGPEIKLLIENGSEKSVTVQSRNTSVNGYMIEPMLSADVAAGKKANDTLTLTQSDLDAAGITTIADIELSFHIFDSESWDTIIDSDPIRIETSAADGFEYLYDDSGDLVYNENGVEIVVKGLSEDGSWLGPSIVVYIKNTGDKNVTVQARDVSINDFMKEQPDAPVKIVAYDEDVEKVGMIMPYGEGSATLQQAINKALGELREEGKLKEISEKYFGMDITEEEQAPSEN